MSDGLLKKNRQMKTLAEHSCPLNSTPDTREIYGTKHVLAETIEKRDPYTGGHTQRVMEYSLAVGGLMGLSGEEIENLKLAAILHDIGKLGISDCILLKNGSLDRDEMQAMNRHPEYGAEILRHVKQLDQVISGVRGHHERYDGNGYPDGLKGEDIPFIARIIAVADTFDAMTTDRPYRKALSVSKAVGELTKQSGAQLDGKIVEIFVRYLSGTGQYAPEGPVCKRNVDGEPVRRVRVEGGFDE